MALIPATTGSIDIDVDTAFDTPKVKVTGSISTWMDDFRNRFRVSNEQILRAIRLLDPDNEYNSYFTVGLRKTLTPVTRHPPVRVRREPVSVNLHKFTNESYTGSSTHSAKRGYTVTNSVAIEWSSSEDVETEFSLGFSMNIVGSAGIKFTSHYGKSENHSSDVTLACEDEVTVSLGPRERKEACLKFTRVYATFDIDYELTYDGDIVGRKDETNRRAKTFKLESILGALKTKTRQPTKVRETVMLDYYTESDTVVRDRSDSKVGGPWKAMLTNKLFYFVYLLLVVIVSVKVIGTVNATTSRR